jgi:2-polyprenyl-6-hydroxyphenyl methylase/3-demethylubiquinone-9 3-methyltransferase
MREALAAASGLVVPNGVFAFALYHRTRMCALWRLEKRWYAGASPDAQRRARAVYIALLRLRFLLTRGDFQSYVETYQRQRGMAFEHNVHDWMGGYPYESISAPEVEAMMQPLGFTRIWSMATPLTFGFFGSGCDEYLYRRTG